MNSTLKKRMFVGFWIVVNIIGAQLFSQTAETQRPSIDEYIHGSWEALERSTADCGSVVDSKVKAKPIVYLPSGAEVPAALASMQKNCGVEVDRLPRVIHRLGDLSTTPLPPGLLYLPHPYVVPGGRFNEMYGWDSYFIILGLINDGRVSLARGIVENFFFEIANYGAVLNANRTYYLTRSQPPLLSSMIAEVYGKTHDKKWLRVAYESAESDHAFWVSPEHEAGKTGLARYFDRGAGPVPEMADDSTYYPDVIRWLIAHPETREDYLVKGSQHPGKEETHQLQTTSCDVLNSRVCADAVADGFRLSAAFYRGDRAMRESGFDTSFRFGTFSGSTDHYAPVCLNSLLYKYERDLATFASILGKPAESRSWMRKADLRRKAISKYLWNEDAGTFSDYNFVAQEASSYRYISEFYPLWAGLATQSQATKEEHQLSTFERDGGLATSSRDSGTQWDLPFGWAPTQWFAIEGLKRYGFTDDATRLSNKFRHTVEANFLLDGTIREKYNVVDGSANIAVAAGYKANVIGFGWTNGVYARLGHPEQIGPLNTSRRGGSSDLNPIVRTNEPPESLRFALILSRHGVRAPLDSKAAYSSQPWPSWEVPPGHLTPHGADALRQMGSYMRDVYDREGLFVSNKCPNSSDLFLYSDTDERNISSTRATFAAFAVGCEPLPVYKVNSEGPDPLFQGDASKVLSPEEYAGARRVALQAEVPNVLSPESQNQLGLLQHILAPDPSDPPEKSFVVPPNQHSLQNSDILEALRPRAIAGEIVGDLLLEYADDKPASEVGWGRVSEATLLKLRPLRIRSFNLEKRTPQLARAARSNMLAHILDTLDQADKGIPTPGAIGPINTRMVYVSGHDSDLASIGGLLGLHWLADNEQDDTQPDSQIVFELWRRAGETQDMMRIRYRGQTLNQLRTASSLTPALPPDEALLTPTGCKAAIGCTWDVFHKAAADRLDMSKIRAEPAATEVVR